MIILYILTSQNTIIILIKAIFLNKQAHRSAMNTFVTAFTASHTLQNSADHITLKQFFHLYNHI
jgi:hypothetical protein